MTATEQKLKELINAGNCPTIRELASQMKLPQKTVKEMAEELELNINVGVLAGNRVWRHTAIGDYTIEDLSAD